ncbi:DNA starvation/stationary phase protection protein Dps [Halosimplex carlsbadense 2-9-1]|uniref:DNA starvation/stationary phase protection protein Dps n=1 Tax=Halosimplex carlsbadense 2-9-1 TaxID=797114 RepID=M0C9K6_9EURY|nr:DNA starvation/stationary phase protection protein Dps [Halosimplex carlsbadense]ELZ19920.1 DNA starvation/stationary phase protection protein Dps [Halosimplex carlsbadense 2-9-1]
MSQRYESGANQQPSGQRSQIETGQTGTGAIGGGRMEGGQAGQGAPTAPVDRLFPTRSYLPESVRASSIAVLNQTLADLSAVTMQLKSAHWNVKGQEFYQLHELFEDLIEEFDEYIDEVAERASALGGRPPGTAREVAANTTIPQLPRETVEGMALVSELADRLAILDANLYEQLELVTAQNDLDTADLVNEVSRVVAKSLWFLEAHLQSRPAAAGGQSPQFAALSGNSQAGSQ